MEKQDNNIAKQNRFQWIWLGLISLIVFGSTIVFVVIAAIRDLSSMENVLLQSIFLSIGCGVSYMVGKQSVAKARDEFLKPYARSAARYLVSLYKSISRARSVTAVELPQGFESYQHYSVIRAYLTAVFTEQLATADDALESWRDILNEEVEDLIQKLQDNTVTQMEIEDLIQNLLPEYEMEDEDEQAN